MSLRRILHTPAVLLSLLTLAPTAPSAAEPPQTNVPYVFVAVDSYNVKQTNQFEVTGLLLGEGTPRTILFTASTTSAVDVSQHLSRCDRMALMAMNKPGAYRFEVVKGIYSYEFSCRLTRTAAIPAP
ncbi:hypothetical protein MYSTI_06978 [Myxococcus stipitatus DSM 14675]|uniref:Lipoprotein n=1 Tax=Myxococcus stipitatus (strain DSM 14675 / JCM 12634 / Mx s8) TaxID=1278073 RepID=L7UK14_MYXSD|nr:hypothetical protein [Myxococcus stipitatus]AGC48250.1 hypothetical protein MYSTI_06978 [Myxococcus stipitatus DSM 14675]